MKNIFLISIILLLVACAPARTSIPTSVPETQAVPRTRATAPMPTLTPTLTPMPTYALSGVIFFDQNGNGVQDNNEPGIPNALIQAGSLSTTTTSDGSYTLRGLTNDDQKIHISASGFRYVAISVDYFQTIDDPLSIPLDTDLRQNWGLMQGFLTLPLESNIPIKIDRMYDHSPGREVLWWNGVHPYDPNDKIFYAEPPGTNEHPGTDYNIPDGTNIIAAAPGKVWRIDASCGAILIIHTFIGGRPIATNYTHLSKILVSEGETISRGQVIGYSGSACTPYPHLHFAVNSAPENTDFWALLDPYSPIVPVPAGFWLSGDPMPTWTTEYHPANGLSLWTAWNSPQFAR